MTWDEILTSDKPILRPADIAPVMGVQQQAINEMAKRKMLPFPYIRSGNRTKIPREGFINWMQGGKRHD